MDDEDDEDWQDAGEEKQQIEFSMVDPLPIARCGTDCFDSGQRDAIILTARHHNHCRLRPSPPCKHPYFRKLLVRTRPSHLQFDFYGKISTCPESKGTFPYA